MVPRWARKNLVSLTKQPVTRNAKPYEAVAES